LGLLLTAGGLLMTVAACGSDAPPPVPAIEQVRGDLYVIMGGDPTDRATFSGGNVAVYVMEQGVAVVDSKLPGYGRQIIEQIRTVTDKPLLAMFHTHTHNDHAGSTPEFPAAIEVVTHENIKASLTRETCLPVTNCQTFQGEGARYLPQTTFSERMSVWFGPDRIDLYHFGPAHTNGDTLVVFPAVRAMHSGDMFSLKRPPFVDTNNGGSALHYPQTLARAAAGVDGVDTIIPGHTAGLFTWAELEEYADFHRDFVAQARAAREAGRTAAEAAAEYVIPDRFSGYNRADPGRIEANIQTIYDELDQ
jgi:glyoxylase-like metal-dependent hydrolase (beta-lactamase superfamily II)